MIWKYANTKLKVAPLAVLVNLMKSILSSNLLMATYLIRLLSK